MMPINDLSNEPDSTLTALGMVEAQVRARGPVQLDLFSQLQEEVEDAARAVVRVQETIDRLNESVFE